MKTKILIFIAALFLSGTLMSSCKSKSSSEKVKNAEENLQDAEMQVSEAQIKLNKALSDSIQLFKAESYRVISANEKSIAAFKQRIEKGNKANKANYEKAVLELEQKNSALKTKLETFNDKETDKWQAFKSEFKNDMKNLGKAISDLTVDNVK